MDIPRTPDPDLRRRLIVFSVGSILAVVVLALLVHPRPLAEAAD